MSSWANSFLQALSVSSTEELIKLLDPKINVTGKDKLGSSELVPHELQQLKQKLTKIAEFPEDAFNPLMQWIVNFLVHSQIVTETKPRPVVHNEIYN